MELKALEPSELDLPEHVKKEFMERIRIAFAEAEVKTTEVRYHLSRNQVNVILVKMAADYLSVEVAFD